MKARKPVILRFPFEWPASLVENGACSGTVRVTLVYSPPLDTSFGVELIRAKLEARLSQKNRKMQGDRDSLYLNQMKSRFSYRKSGKSYGNAAIIDHGLKWWPCKQYECNLNRRGDSGEWRLEVVSQIRAEASFPISGIPIFVILTLEDPNGELPVFREMQQILNNYGAVTRSIQNATRVRPHI